MSNPIAAEVAKVLRCIHYYSGENNCGYCRPCAARPAVLALIERLVGEERGRCARLVDEVTHYSDIEDTLDELAAAIRSPHE